MELPDYEMPALGVDDLVADGEKQAPPCRRRRPRRSPDFSPARLR